MARQMLSSKEAKELCEWLLEDGYPERNMQGDQMRHVAETLLWMQQRHGYIERAATRLDEAMRYPG